MMKTDEQRAGSGLVTHGFQSNLDLHLSRETDQRFAHRLGLLCLAGSIFFPFYTLLDVQIGWGKLPAWQMHLILGLRLAGALLLALSTVVLLSRKPIGLWLKAMDLFVFSLAGTITSYIIAACWHLVHDFWVGLAQIIVARCILLPGGPRRALPVCLVLLVALPLSLFLFRGLDPSVFAGESGTRLQAAMMGLIGFAAIGLLGSYLYQRTLDLAVRAHHQGRYVIEHMLGRGGMGAVYRAWDTRLSRVCALKVIATQGMKDPAEARARFENEAQRTSQLRGSHIIEIYDYGETVSGDLYYSMELLDGMTLEAMVCRYGPLPPARVIFIGRQICAGLSTAHRNGLIHRDIKPANLFVCPRDENPDFIKILDFGLIKAMAAGAGPLPASGDTAIRFSDGSPPPERPLSVTEQTAATVAQSLTGPTAHAVTAAGMLLGTPSFMAPEQVLSRDPDPRCDLYAVGGVLYYLATAELPFGEGDPVRILTTKLREDPPAPSARGRAVPEDLDALILACLDRDPDKRPATASELRDRLGELRDADTWTARQAEAFWAAHRPGPGDAAGTAKTQPISGFSPVRSVEPRPPDRAPAQVPALAPTLPAPAAPATGLEETQAGAPCPAPEAKPGKTT